MFPFYLCPFQSSTMTNERTKVKFNWLKDKSEVHTAFVSPTKFQKNEVGLARPTCWGDDPSDEWCKDSSPSLDMSTSSVELAEMANIKLSTPREKCVTPSQTQGSQKTHRLSSRPRRLFEHTKVIGLYLSHGSGRDTGFVV